MKKIVIILLMMLATAGAYGQGHHGHRDSHRDSRHRTENVHRGNHHRGNRGNRHSNHHGRGYNVPEELECRYEWQELWNGCHVRIKLDKIYIYDAYDTKVVSGDKVILLPNGLYKVYNGAFWHVHAPSGERVSNIWGDEVDLMSNGVFRCYRAGSYVYYDPDGRKRE